MKPKIQPSSIATPAERPLYFASPERDVRGSRQDARDAFRAANEKSHLLLWSYR